MIKKYWWIGLIVVFSVVLFVQHIKINRLNDDVQIKNVELSTLKDTVLTVVTRNGQLISTVNSVQIEKDNIKESLQAMGLDLKALKDENIKLKTLNFVLNAQLTSSGDVATPTKDTFRIPDDGGDSIRYSIVSDWTDTRLSLFNGIVENNNLTFDYTYNLRFKLLSNTEKNKTIVTFVPDDKTGKTIISSANSITIINKKKWYERGWVWAVAGVTGGILIAK